MSPPLSAPTPSLRPDSCPTPFSQRVQHPQYTPLCSPDSVNASRSTEYDAWIEQSRRDVSNIVAGADPRLLVVVGPCSMDDPDTALSYAHELRRFQDEFADELLLCMRTYFEKPRTTVGWKGWFSDPYADGSHDVEHGVRTGIELLRQLTEMGLATATELLDPLFVPFVAPWLSWAAVGARTAESQVHRQTVSTLPFAVGFKNGTDGSIDIALAAMQSAAVSHTFPSVCGAGRLQLVHSTGNAACHVVLRGGASGPNFDELSVARVHQKAREMNANHLQVMIDCSHGNSSKDYRNQPRVLREVARQVALGGPVSGVMLESYLIAGNQPVTPRGARRLGQSMTDGCIDLPTTRDALTELARAVRRRARSAA